jgi:hypothetical protein
MHNVVPLTPPFYNIQICLYIQNDIKDNFKYELKQKFPSLVEWRVYICIWTSPHMEQRKDVNRKLGPV